MTPIENLAQRLGDIPFTTMEKAVRAKSRDFFWYSPLLKERLDHIIADAVVSPRDEAEVLQVLTACYDLDIPVTARGAGTGNYGQAMPLAGGIVLDLARFNRIKSIRDGVVVTEPGVVIGDLDEACKDAVGQELRMHPSTRETATIGGFIAGGSAGVGSITWGALAVPGNILRIRMATMEAEPRLVDLTGPDILKAHHVYGLTGIITEIELPLAPAPDWIEMLVGFDDWKACIETGYKIARNDGFWLKEVGAVQAPAPYRYFRRHQKFLRETENVVCVLVAPNSVDALADMVSQDTGRIVYRSDQTAAEDKKGLPHLHHLLWNHTTLRALKTDSEMTYLQMSFPEDDVAACVAIAERFPGEVINHVEYTRGMGKIRMSSLPLVRFTDEARLRELMSELEDLGCEIWNPHAYTWEEGNRSDADAGLIAMKREFDPKGLLNPGKMIGWNDPSYVYDPKGEHVFAGLQKVDP